MSGYFGEVFHNSVLLVSIAAWFVAQLIKLLIELARTRKVELSLFLSTGGMPSSHTSFVVAMGATLGLKYGFDSPYFAISAVLSMIVMTDAAGVRRAAGKQAAVINMLVESLEHQGIKLDKKLKELLGHSPVEVAAGAILGVLIAVLSHRG
ncbi:MAG: divergent PAP2 family protein [Clostridiales bacterium]|nr:divergent PAP2 family protein [Clostridiales bacterium]